MVFLDVGSPTPPAHLAHLTCPCSVGRPKHMRVMAGALEGDLFIGPKAEVTPMEPAFAGAKAFIAHLAGLRVFIVPGTWARGQSCTSREGISVFWGHLFGVFLDPQGSSSEVL